MKRYDNYASALAVLSEAAEQLRKIAPTKSNIQAPGATSKAPVYVVIR